MRLNISVPDDLAAQVRERRLPVSAICQRALREEIAGPAGGIPVILTVYRARHPDFDGPDGGDHFEQRLQLPQVPAIGELVRTGKVAAARVNDVAWSFGEAGLLSVRVMAS